VGQDVGGMVTYAYLRTFPDLMQSVIMDVVIPGIDPWEQVLANPYIWHFASTRSPSCQRGSCRDTRRSTSTTSTTPSRPTVEDHSRGPGGLRAGLRHRRALTAGFNWYRTFPQDAAANKEANSQATMTTRLLYLRGEKEGGQIGDYWTACGLPG